MRKLFSLVAALGLVMGAAPPAHAVVLELAGAKLSLTIGTLPAVNFSWSGPSPFITADLYPTAVLSLTPGMLTFAGTLPITDPLAFPMTALSITGGANGVGNFVGTSPSLTGLMAVMGVANICLAGPCGAVANITVPLTLGPGVNGVGLGGAPIVPPPGFVNVTVMGNGWTTGTVAISSFSATGSPLGAVEGPGHVKLVTPTVILTSNPSFPVIPSFATLELWVPEPGTLILLASGVAGLAMVGRKRMSK